jgi:hypothetical protein
MNSREFFKAFVALATIQTGLTAFVIYKGLKFCALGILSPAIPYLYFGIMGLYLLSKSVESISKLISFKRY